MAKSLFKLTTILILLTLLALHLPKITSTDRTKDDDDDKEYYTFPRFISRSRFLGSKVHKGDHCNPNYNNICNGVSANKGNELLQCCKKKCVNVLGDMNHCGKCEHKCKQGEQCCNGVCTNVMNNVYNCGKCNRKCKPEITCQVGFCGYA